MADGAEELSVDSLAVKNREVDALLARLTSKAAELDGIVSAALEAKVATEAARSSATTANIEITAAKARAEADAAQVTVEKDAAAASRIAAEGERDKVTLTGAAVTAAKATAEADLERITQVSQAVTAAKTAAEAEKDQAAVARRDAEASKNSAKTNRATSESESTRAAEAASAAVAAKTTAETQGAAATAAAQAAAEAKTKVEADRDASAPVLAAIKETLVQATAAKTSTEQEQQKAKGVAAAAIKSKGEAEAAAKVIAELQKESEGARTAAQEALQAARAARLNAENEARAAAEAHNISTTVGLAGAFNVQAFKSRTIGWVWVFILVCSLGAVCAIGIWRYTDITALIAQEKDPWTLGVALLVAIFGVSGPIWIAWVATRMVSKNFSLTEDYAYKAALAKAYVGFKSEATGLDPIFEQRLFAAAITQLDANPVRFLDSAHPGSPLQELFQQPFMIDVINDPNVKGPLIDWMNRTFKTRLLVSPKSDASPQAGTSA